MSQGKAQPLAVCGVVQACAGVLPQQRWAPAHAQHSGTVCLTTQLVL